MESAGWVDSLRAGARRMVWPGASRAWDSKAGGFDPMPGSAKETSMSDTQTVLPDQSASSPRAHEIGAQTLYDKCMALASNLWWSWHPEVINLFRDLDPIRWRQLDHNPIALLKEFTPSRLESRATETVLYSRIHHAYRQLKEYMSTSRPTWATTNAGVLGAHPVAYFSAEFGIHESVPIYSGGLGVLSGDHIKSASGLGIPLVAVGLFYDQGYFKQRLDENGYQLEEYLDTKVENLPVEHARGADGEPIMVSILSLIHI